MKALQSLGLLGRLLAILVVVAGIDFAANTLVFERASNFALHADDARRMASQLEISRRIVEHLPRADRGAAIRELTTPGFELALSRQANRAEQSVELATLRRQMIELEPALAGADLQLHLLSLSAGGDIAGSVRLSDGSLLAFTSHNAIGWPLTAQRIVALVAPTLVLLALGWLLLRATLAPLRRLVHATREVGLADPQPLAEEGPPELREVIHGFNAMQHRIHELISARTQSLLAIGHDLRTPLARLRLRLDDARIEQAVRGEISGDLDEMEDLLESLRAFVDPGAAAAEPERVDLAAMAMTIVDNLSDAGHDARYEGPDHLDARLRAVAIRRVLTNLSENAVHHGGSALVTLAREPGAVVMTVEDSGPGIPEDRIEDVQEPFVRLNEARTRNTRGMGLGLAIVRRAIQQEGGSFTLANRAGGGLVATVRLPIGNS